MLQPFERFKPSFIPRLLELDRRWLVSQTYTRRGDLQNDLSGKRVALLFSDYAALGEAKLHVNAVKKDRYAAIIDLHQTAHLEKVNQMLDSGSQYQIFFSVVKSASALERQINKNYKEKLKQYIDKHSNWKISHDNSVRSSIQLSFGELFIILRHGSQRIRIKFEEIEKA